jgi:hypothetical protein
MVSHLSGITQNEEVHERSAKYYGIPVFETKTQSCNRRPGNTVQFGASYRRSEGLSEVLLETKSLPERHTPVDW